MTAASGRRYFVFLEITAAICRPKPREKQVFPDGTFRERDSWTTCSKKSLEIHEKPLSDDKSILQLSK